MSNFTLYHNPKCSKSRQALALLQENGIEPTIVEYLEEPLSKSELKNLLKLLGLGPRDLLRTKEPEYKSLNLADKNLKDEDIIDVIVKNPRLLERPIVVKGKKAVLGRPTENILKLL